jgi:chemotaxis protein CheC
MHGGITRGFSTGFALMPDKAAITLTELELDTLTELVNLGVGNAALSLREMVREEVLLTVPAVSIMSRAQAIVTLGQRSANRLVAVHQNFEGDIRGRALLIFPEAQSMELVRALVGSELSPQDLMDLEQEALAETGNVLLNACLGTIANNLQRSLRISLPEVVHGDGSDFFDLRPQPDIADSVLFISINFSLHKRDVQGYLAMLLDLPSLLILKGLLASLVTRMSGTFEAALPRS